MSLLRKSQIRIHTQKTGIGLWSNQERDKAAHAKVTEWRCVRCAWFKNSDIRSFREDYSHDKSLISKGDLAGCEPFKLGVNLLIKTIVKFAKCTFSNRIFHNADCSQPQFGTCMAQPKILDNQVIKNRWHSYHTIDDTRRPLVGL